MSVIVFLLWEHSMVRFQTFVVGIEVHVSFTLARHRVRVNRVFETWPTFSVFGGTGCGGFSVDRASHFWTGRMNRSVVMCWRRRGRQVLSGLSRLLEKRRHLGRFSRGSADVGGLLVADSHGPFLLCTRWRWWCLLFLPRGCWRCHALRRGQNLLTELAGTTRRGLYFVWQRQSRRRRRSRAGDRGRCVDVSPLILLPEQDSWSTGSFSTFGRSASLTRLPPQSCLAQRLPIPTSRLRCWPTNSTPSRRKTFEACAVVSFGHDAESRRDQGKLTNDIYKRESKPVNETALGRACLDQGGENGARNE